MPSSKKISGKKTLTRVKKHEGKSQKGKGKVGDEDKRKEALKGSIKEMGGCKGPVRVRDQAKGKEAVIATVRPEKGEDKNRKSDPAPVLSNVGLMPGTVLSMSDHHLINVKISKWEEIGVIISINDSYADITSKIQLRARELGMSMPSNWELLARVQSVCMFKNLADCRDFLIVPHGGYTNYQHSTLLKPHLQPWARKPRLLNDKGCMKKPSAAHNCELPTIEG